MTTALAVVDDLPVLSVELARDLLAKSKSVDEVRDVADKAKAIGLYLRTKNASIDAQNDAIEIRIRAERRIGELLEGIKQVRGPRDRRGEGKMAKLKSLGIKTTEAIRCSSLALIPEERLDYYLSETRKAGQLLTANLPLKYAQRERQAQHLKKNADPALVKAFELGKISSYEADSVVELQIPAWKQRDIAADPKRCDEILADARRRLEPSRDLKRFVESAEECARWAKILSKSRAIPVQLKRDLDNSIAAIVEHAKKNSKAGSS